MHQLIFQCLLQMFYESDSSSEFVFPESKSSYSFSLLSDFPMVSVSSYLEYPNRVSVQTDNSEKFRILTDLSRRFGMPPSKDLNFENRVFRILYKIFVFENLCFCKPIPQPSCCNLALIPLNVTPQTRPRSYGRIRHATSKTLKKFSILSPENRT